MGGWHLTYTCQTGRRRGAGDVRRCAWRSTLRPFSFTIRRAGRSLAARRRRVGRRRGDPRPVPAVHRGRARRRGARCRSSARWPRDGARAARRGLTLGFVTRGRRDGRADDRAARRTTGSRSCSTADGRAAAAGAGLGAALRGAAGRPGAAPPSAPGSGRPRHPARRRSPLHRARLPAGDARRRRHPPGRLRAGAVAAVQPRATACGVAATANGTCFDLAGERISVSTRGQAGPLRARGRCAPAPRRRGCASCAG